MNGIFGVRSGWCASAGLLMVLYAAVLVAGVPAEHLVALVLGESVLIALGGAGVGLGLLYPAAQLYAVMVAGGKTVPSYNMTPETIWLCLGMMLAVGLIAAIWPVLHLSRMTTLDGLRHSG